MDIGHKVVTTDKAEAIEVSKKSSEVQRFLDNHSDVFVTYTRELDGE